MRKFSVKVPIRIKEEGRRIRKINPDSKKRKKKKTKTKNKEYFYYNLNIFRNADFKKNNEMKKKFGEIVKEILEKENITFNYYFEYFKLDYYLYIPDKRKRDVSNVCSIIDKNFCDVIVEVGIVKEDRYEYLQQISYNYGGFDKTGEGYVICEVTEQLETDMKD